MAYDEQDLKVMIGALRRFLGNRTTSGIWQQHMQTFCGPGWSRASFKRRLKVLKDREWVRIVGEPDVNLKRAPEGALYEATDKAPEAEVVTDTATEPGYARGDLHFEPGHDDEGGSSQPGSDLAHESEAMTEAADTATKAAMELVQRLTKGKPPHAA